MDTSEIYVKMCEKAKEIQEFAPLDFGSWYAYLRPLTGLWCHPDDKGGPYGKDRDYFLAHPIRPNVNLIVEDFDGSPMHIYEEYIEHCWLPRQDQLQAMVMSSGMDVTTLDCFAVSLLGNRFHDFCEREYNKLRLYLRSQYIGVVVGLCFASFEQLWLAFVMKERFGKVWDFEKEDWMKSTSSQG